MRVPAVLCTLGFFVAASVPASAAVTTSGACLQSPRSISVTSETAATCLAAGRGVLRGAEDAFRTDWLGWLQLETSEPGVRNIKDGWLSGALNGSEGSFAIDAAAYAAYDHIGIGLQTGGSRSDPDWVVFELSDMTLVGQWAISAQSVGHVVLYGMNGPMPNVLAVSEPTSFALAGVALAGLGMTRRRLRRA